MKLGIKTGTRNIFLLSLFVLGLVAVLIFLPSQFSSEAGSQKNSKKESIDRTDSHEEGIENYDIRTDKYKGDALLGFRQSAGKNAVVIADTRDRFVAGENLLRQRVPTLKVEYNNDIRIPEVIAPDVDKGRAFLTEASNSRHSEILRNFVRENNDLVGVEDEQINLLKVAADYTNPDGNLSYAHLEQTINGIPVFRGEIKAGFTRNGEMFRIINNLAPGLDYYNLSTEFRNPLDAVRAAANNINYELKGSDLIQNKTDSTNSIAVFGYGDTATTAEKMYFPTEPGVARTAWRVLIWKPANAYYVIVDAETGTMLWRKNITDDQTQPATYNVYSNTTNMINTLNNPAPIIPGPNSPNGVQGAVVPRSNVTLIGNEAPNTFNNLGWITDNINGVNGTTDGNNVQAGLDIVAPDGVDATVNGTNRVFNFAYNPAPGNPPPGESPTLPDFRNGVVTQLFYTSNRYHDELYKLGFTEASRNFQNDNFGRGGVANDRVLGEAQDFSGTDNANFSTPADGTSGRMQMYVFTSPNPDYDGSLDADFVVHELTHGTSNRLIGNGGGLGNNRGRSMGEGWSDFYGLALLANPTDPLAANYATGGYAAYLFTGEGYTFNYYYGIRRFPYAIRSFTGGPSNLPHNPLTFADIDPAQANLSDGAFAPNPTFAGSPATEVHNAGEVWAIALWEVRAQFITRLGAAVGNAKTLQLVTDGMKLTPLNPNFIQARDAIISAAVATAAADVVDVREGFRIRGMGFGAQDNAPAVVQSFAFPNVVLTNPFSVSDSTGNNNGFPEPGENVLLSIAITNTTGTNVNNVTVNVNGGPNVSYGNIANGATVTMQIPFTIPAGATCGSIITVTIDINSDAGTQAPQMRSFSLGAPVFGSPTQNFDGVVQPALPVGWTQTNSGANTGWVTTTVNVVSLPNSVFSPDSGTNGDATLETSANITSASAQLSYSNRFNTENDFDGTVLDIRIGNSAFQDILAAGGSFVSGGYTGTLIDNTPLGARQAWTGTPAPNPVNTVINLPASANGQTIVLRWRTASDETVGGQGTWYDNMQLTGGNFLSAYSCGVPPTPTPTPTATPTPTPTPTPIVSGRVTYANSLTTTSVPFTTINAAGSIPLSTMTNSNGDYSLSGFGAGAYTITPTKANQINGISNLDASTVAQHVAELITLNPTQQIAADTSGNGAISSLDAAYIAQFVAAIANPSITGSWKFNPASRPYPSVMTNQTNQDYSAILVGDVTGNWNPAGALRFDLSTWNPTEPLRFDLSAAESGQTRQAEKAAKAEGVTVTAQRNESAGEKVMTLNLTATETTGEGILGYQFELLYDAAVIEPQAISCDVSETISSGMTAICRVSEPGVLKVVVFGATPLTGEGTLLKLNFKMVGTRGSTSGLSIENFMFNENLPSAVTVKGQW
jgi:hypothetical protein